MKRATIIFLAIGLVACTSNATTTNQQGSMASSVPVPIQESSNSSSIPAGADETTYTWLDFNVGKDAQHVFCNEKVVVGADAATFDFLATDSRTFFKDKAHVYDCDLLPGLDPDTTKLYPLPDVYLSDRDGIYDVRAKKHVREQDIPCSSFPSPEDKRLPHCNSSSSSSQIRP